MSDGAWKSKRARVIRWLARSLHPESVGSAEVRPRIRFGPESAATSSPARWWLDKSVVPPSYESHPSYVRPRDREGEYERLRAEIAQLAHPDDRPFGRSAH
jgi:hypothetical protein